VAINSGVWDQINLTPGTTLSLGSPASLPAGTVTGLGWFNAAGVDNWRVDNFTYSAVVPEPAMLSLLGLGALGFLRRRRVAE
jgi:hypothetical protein